MNSKVTFRESLLFLLLVLTNSILAQEVYVHEATGLKFPATVGGFTRTSAGKNALLGNTHISYDRLDKKQQTAVTIYLGKKEGSLAQQMEDLEASVMMFHSTAKVLTRKSRKIGAYEGMIVVFQIPGDAGGEISEGCLFKVGSMTLKLRMTGPFSEKDKLLAGVQSLLTTVLR